MLTTFNYISLSIIGAGLVALALAWWCGRARSPGHGRYDPTEMDHLFNCLAQPGGGDNGSGIDGNGIYRKVDEGDPDVTK